MTVERLSDHNGRAEWNQFLRLSPQGSIFASTKYLDALDARYDLFCWRNDKEIEIGLPLARGIGRLLTNPFFCKYLGVMTHASGTEKPSIAAGQLYRKVDALGGRWWSEADLRLRRAEPRGSIRVARRGHTCVAQVHHHKVG